MRSLERSETLVLYIGRTVLKVKSGYINNIFIYITYSNLPSVPPILKK